MLIITGTFNEKTNELTIYGITCQYITINYQQKLGKIEGMQDSKLNFSSSCFNADDSHVKIVWLHAVTFSENDVLYF